MFSVDTALQGIGLAYAFAQLSLPYIKATRLNRVVTSFSPTFPGFCAYYPSKRQKLSTLTAFVDFVQALHRRR